MVYQIPAQKWSRDIWVLGFPGSGTALCGPGTSSTSNSICIYIYIPHMCQNRAPHNPRSPVSHPSFWLEKVFTGHFSHLASDRNPNRRPPSPKAKQRGTTTNPKLAQNRHHVRHTRAATLNGRSSRAWLGELALQFTYSVFLVMARFCIGCPEDVVEAARIAAQASVDGARLLHERHR